MDVILSQLPPWLIVGVVVLAVGLIAFLVVRSLQEGREISFWPPRIGPKVNDETSKAEETAKAEEVGELTPQVTLRSEPLGMIRAISGLSHGLCVFLTEQTRKLSFGRSSGDADSIGIKDMAMSRPHFAIRVTPIDQSDKGSRRYQIQVFDLGSSNGTSVNGDQIQMADLHDGDLIQAGGSSFRVYLFRINAG